MSVCIAEKGWFTFTIRRFRVLDAVASPPAVAKRLSLCGAAHDAAAMRADSRAVAPPAVALMAPQKSALLPGAGIVALLGVPASTVSKWKADGCPYRVQSGRPVYLVSQVVAWLVAQPAIDARADVPEKSTEEARKLRAQADIAEMDRDERVCVLVERHSVDAAQLAENIRTRSILLSVPARYARDVADDLGVPIRKCAHALDAMMRSVLDTLASDDDDDDDTSQPKR